MKTQEIGQSGMIASRVALGVMRMDALDAADAARTVAVAHDSGIDYFDTADIYGFHDHAAHASSKRFGQAWKDAGLDRSTIFIQTKFGIDYSFGENDGGANGYDFSAKHLIDALSHELEALQTDYVDAVGLHRIETHSTRWNQAVKCVISESAIWARGRSNYCKAAFVRNWKSTNCSSA